MRKLDIVESIQEPNPNSIWLKDNTLKKFSPNGWIEIGEPIKIWVTLDGASSLSPDKLIDNQVSYKKIIEGYIKGKFVEVVLVINGLKKVTSVSVVNNRIILTAIINKAIGIRDTILTSDGNAIVNISN